MAKKKTQPRRFSVVLERDEDGVYIVSIPTLVGCRSYGRTVDEALKNISEAAALCLADSSKSVVRHDFVGVFDIEIAA